LTASIRLAREADLAALPAVELSAAQAFRDTYAPQSLLRHISPPEHWASMQASGTLWVAEEEDRGLIAFLAATSIGDRLHIDEFDVALEAQRRGLGRRMLSQVIAWAKDAGFACLSLTTFASIPWNAPFYRSLGFEAWTDDQPVDIELALAGEATRGLPDRCAMRLLL
jgi:GNAT superfamily N-acetyltransferase